MDKQSLTYKTFKNISYGLFGYVWTFVFSIFITPVIVFKLGVETYGVYMLVLTVNSLLGLFDLGIANILVKYIAEYQAANDEKRLKALMYSFNSILLASSIFSLVVLAAVGFWAKIFFPSDTISAGYYFTVFLLSGLVTFVSGISALFSIVPVALQRADISTKLGLASLTLSNLSILLLVVLGYGLKGIFLSQLFFGLLFFVIYRYYARRILPTAELKFAWEWAEVKKAYKFGITAYMSNAANSALTYFDRLLIPIFNGPAALSYYSLPGNFAAKTPGVISSISGIIFPMISSLNGLKDMEKIKNIYTRAFNLLTVISFAVTVSIVMFSNKILLYWLNADFAAKSTNVLIILTWTYFFLSLGGTLNFFLLGLSKTKFLFHSSLFMALFNVGLLFLLLPKYGIVGAAWAYLISVLPIIYMFYYTERHILDLGNRFFDYFKLYFKLALVSVPFWIISTFAILPLVKSLKMVILFGPVSVLLFLFIYRVFGFYDQKDIKLIDTFVWGFLKKLRIVKVFSRAGEGQ